MSKTTISTTESDRKIIDKIYFIRNKKVMLDRDLAELYGVETKVLNQAVRRNEKRFPEDFMFQLAVEELQNLKSQFVTSSWGGSRKLPWVFTEQGVAMLSSILNSETAIEVNIKIIRIFTKMREILLNNKDILLKLEQVEQTLLKHDAKMIKHEQEIRMIFEVLKKLLTPPREPRPRIGFRRNDEQN